jgi:hypothetical protein
MGKTRSDLALAVHDQHAQAETALKADKFMLVVNGSGVEILRAKELLGTSGPSSFHHHPAPNEVPSAVHA